MRNERREIKPRNLSDLNCCITSDMEFFLDEILPCIAQNYRPVEFNEFLAVRGGELKLSITDVKSKLGEFGAKDICIKQKENGKYNIEFFLGYKTGSKRGKGKEAYIYDITCS